jgi:hypothetical protein
MSKMDFDRLVDRVLKQNSSLTGMRTIVEKEILHYDIFNALSTESILGSLVFQGGTSLRLCRGSSRFSEDLDFAGGRDFTAETMSRLKKCLEEYIGQRYGLPIRVKEPAPGKSGNSGVRVEKWMVTVQTQPENSSFPSQKIKIEIANVPAYTCEHVEIRKNYDFLGPQKILVFAESTSEVLADKVAAFPTSLFESDGSSASENSRLIRHRDIWDIAWLLKNGAKLDPKFVNDKINLDYRVPNYMALLENAIKRLPEIAESEQFQVQMQRFIDPATRSTTIGSLDFVRTMASDVRSVFSQMLPNVKANAEAAPSPRSAGPSVEI